MLGHEIAIYRAFSLWNKFTITWGLQLLQGMIEINAIDHYKVHLKTEMSGSYLEMIIAV